MLPNMSVTDKEIRFWIGGQPVHVDEFNLTILPGGLPRVVPAIKEVIFHKPATIIYWGDGTKTVVKTAPGVEFSEYNGFCAAVAKKLFGGAGTMRIVKNASRRPAKKGKRQVEQGAPFDEPFSALVDQLRLNSETREFTVTFKNGGSA